MICISQFQGFNITPEQMNLLFRIRIIWRDIATWMRAYLIYTFLNSDPVLKQAAAEQLNNLPTAYRNVFKQYFGDKVADEYVNRLSDYIRLLISLIDAEKSGDTYAINEYTRQIYLNVDNRVNLLSKINPFWQKETFLDLLNNFTKMTISEITTFANKDYLRNTDLYKSILSYTDSMGDYIADGLVKYLAYLREPGAPE